MGSCFLKMLERTLYRNILTKLSFEKIFRLILENKLKNLIG